jgi:predicted nucleotide-binding protein
MKFTGTPDELMSLVSGFGLSMDWTEENGKICGRTKALAAVVNWWPKTGTLQVQGKEKEKLETLLTAAVSSKTAPVGDPVNKLKIFIVHGHDTVAREQLELVLHRLGLNPYILQNQDGGSKTIIENLEQNIYSESAFGIVLMTPDDYGYRKDQADAERQPRTRQNVIMEMGMVMASLGRDRMAILKKGNLEIPSDADGIIRLEFNDSVKEVVPKLVQRLQNAGIHIDASRIALASS